MIEGKTEIMGTFIIPTCFFSPPVRMHGGLICNICMSVCLSVLTPGLLLASWCVQIPTYWLLFLLAIAGMLARVRVQKWGCWFNKPTKKQTHPDKKSVWMCLDVYRWRLY